MRLSKIEELQPILVLFPLASQIKFKRKFEALKSEDPASEDDHDVGVQCFYNYLGFVF